MASRADSSACGDGLGRVAHVRRRAHEADRDTRLTAYRRTVRGRAWRSRRPRACASARVGPSLGAPAGGRGVDGPLACHRPRVAAGLDAREGSLAQEPVGRPFGELRADDEARASPARTRDAGSVDDGRRVDAVGVELLAEQAPLGGVEAAAHLSGEPPLVPLARGHDERAKLRVRAPAGLVADDHQLLLAPDLDLQPGTAATAGLVGRAAQLGHDALDALLLGGRVEGLAILEDMAQVAHARTVRDHAPEQPLALLEGDRQERAAVQVEQVEDVVDEGSGRSRACSPGSLSADVRRSPRCAPSPCSPVRSWSRLKLALPRSSSATTSPSTIASWPRIHVGAAAASSGK